MDRKNLLKLFFATAIAICPGFVLAQENNYKESALPEIKLKVSEYEEKISSGELANWVIWDPYLSRDTQKISEIENIRYCGSDYVFCRLTLTAEKTAKISKYQKIKANEKNIRSSLEDMKRKVNRDPINASFAVEEGKVVIASPSKNGIELDVEKGIEKISQQLILENGKKSNTATTIELPYKEIPPPLSSEDVEKLKINKLIGEGKSNFRGSPKNRIFNINVAISRFNSVLIKPGEEFSFVKVLGSVDGEHGYKEELVIKKDKTEPEFGGGVCQVSTTTFRAAIYSGLKVTARRNHAYPVRYYNPQGLDATVYVPRPDLRFINNTPGYILIQTKIEGTELIFQFYGTDDGRRIEIIGPKITEKNPDGSMKATFTQNVYDKDGKQIISDIFNSSYDSPNKYPHPGEIFTEKPDDWSEKQWRQYKKEHNI